MARTWLKLVFLIKHKQNTMLWNQKPLQYGQSALFENRLPNNSNLKISVHTDSGAALSELDFRPSSKTISLSQKSSETHFAQHFLLLSIQLFDLYLSRSFYSFFTIYKAFLLRSPALVLFTLHLACSSWTPFFSCFCSPCSLYRGCGIFPVVTLMHATSTLYNPVSIIFTLQMACT